VRIVFPDYWGNCAACQSIHQPAHPGQATFNTNLTLADIAKETGNSFLLNNHHAASCFSTS
jgi:hypothetical protein